MAIQEIIGYISALAIGITLGLIGSGGSILSVPVLAYLFQIDEKLATGYSLFIVGSVSLFGGIKQHLNQLVNWKIVLIFGIPSIIGVIIIRKFIVPDLPENIFTVGNFICTRRMLMFGLFALLMIPAAFYMLLDKKNASSTNNTNKINYFIIALEGIIVGGLTGLVGAGGGFLIIPALILFAGLEMKQAVATSLIIIAFKSLLGFFLGDALQATIQWTFLLSFTAITLLGIFIGTYISQFIDGNKLKKIFAYFVLSMAIFIFYKEFF